MTFWPTSHSPTIPRVPLPSVIEPGKPHKPRHCSVIVKGCNRLPKSGEIILGLTANRQVDWLTLHFRWWTLILGTLKIWDISLITILIALGTFLTLIMKVPCPERTQSLGIQDGWSFLRLVRSVWWRNHVGTYEKTRKVQETGRWNFPAF